MLKNAMLYMDEINKKYYEIAYDLDYQYYIGNCGGPIHFHDNCYEHPEFVSVDENDNVIGVFKYSLDRAARRAYNFGAISFDRGNTIFTIDMLRAIDDIFRKYKMHTMEFWAFVDNPITPTYTKLVEKYGGRIVGVLKDCMILQDGQLHDSIIYELSLWGYIAAKEGVKNV